MTKKGVLKLIFLALMGIVLFLLWKFNVTSYLTLDYVKQNLTQIHNYYAANKLLVMAIYFVGYVIVTALSIPGAAILTLLAGALFGLGLGLLIVSFASTIGATLAFLMSRFLLKDYIQEKFSAKIQTMNDGMKRDGAFYLFALRLVPIFPFFMINLVMGIVPIRVWTFYWVSQLGMLMGTIFYVNAGLQLSKLDSLKGIISWPILLSLAALGVLPILSKKLLSIIKSYQVLKKYKKPKNYDFNMIVIGGGSAGLVSAYIAATVKAKVALVEQEKMGGDCLNTGCVPSKAIIKTAKIISDAKKASKYGIKSINVDFDFKEVMERVQNVITKIEPHDSIERYEGLGVKCYTGKAKIVSPYEVEVDGQVLTTKKIIVASGASPFVPPIKGIDNISVLTSNTLWNLRELPKKLVVMGGGFIGIEMAQTFARLGSDVTLVEMLPRIMMVEDEDVAHFVASKLTADGVRILTEHQVIEFGESSGEKYLICLKGEEKVRIDFDEVLCAVGRRANTKGFGLEELGVNLLRNGMIEVNEYQQTNIPTIYACGDVTGPFQLTHTAAHQAWYASVNALFGVIKKFKVDYSTIPWCTYSDPEVARVGISEQEAKRKGVSYETTLYDLSDLDRAIVDSCDEGFVKVLTEKNKDKILGVTIVGSKAGELILEFICAMKHGIGLNKILGTIHIYPTMGEANKYAAGVWKKNHAPQKVLKFLQGYFNMIR